MPVKKTTKEAKVKETKIVETQIEEKVDVLPLGDVSTATVDVEAVPTEPKAPAKQAGQFTVTKATPVKVEKKVEKVVDYIHGQYLFR